MSPPRPAASAGRAFLQPCGLLAALCASAARRERDAFGRLLPADTDGFATHWLAAARYTSAVSESLCAAAWEPRPEPAVTG